MKHTAFTILATLGVLCLVASNGACSSDDGGVFPAECNSDGRCNGVFEGTIAGVADTAACADRHVMFRVTERAVQFSDFEADCDLAPCYRCQGSFSRSATIDPDTCTFNISQLGIININGELNQGSCTVSGTYSYGGPPACPCWDQGSWSASR